MPTVMPQMKFSAGSGWGHVKDVIKANENGDRSNAVVVQPGGKLTVVPRSDTENTAQPLTVLPSDRMAAVTIQEMNELQRLDPNNMENWHPVQPPFLRGEQGWGFEMEPPFHEGFFEFLAFRDPGRNNEWQVSPIFPDYDDYHGHAPHMISTQIGGRNVPVICGPAGRTHPSLSSVRAAAAKWTAYTSARMVGEDPGFSL